MPKRQVVQYIRKSDSGRGAAKQRERMVQRALTRWLNIQKVDFYNDYASGAYLTYGQNAARLTLASKQGWVDLFIAEPSRGYAGMFLELKHEDVRIYLKDGKTLSANPQIRKEAEFLERMKNKGYFATFACGYDEAKRLIEWYLKLTLLADDTEF